MAVTLDGADPLLYAAQKTIGPLQLIEEEARTTARRAFEQNPKLTPVQIGKAIGRARRTVDEYIADLRATFQLGLDLKISRMHCTFSRNCAGRLVESCWKVLGWCISRV